MFSHTLPFTAPTDFEPTGVPTTVMADDSDTGALTAAGASTLSPSLLLDLKRFAEVPTSADLLAVAAASVRHGKPLALTLELDDRALELTLRPRQHVFCCEVDLCALSDPSLTRLKVRRVEPDAQDGELFTSRLHIGSLRPLLWHLAMRGSNANLVPELAGPVRCRVTVGAPLYGLPIDGRTWRLIERMKKTPGSLDELFAETRMARPAIQRAWNALYLQSALMVFRSFAH